MWAGFALQKMNMAKAIRLGIGWAISPAEAWFQKELQRERDIAEGKS